MNYYLDIQSGLLSAERLNAQQIVLPAKFTLLDIAKQMLNRQLKVVCFDKTTQSRIFGFHCSNSRQGRGLHVFYNNYPRPNYFDCTVRKHVKDRIIRDCLALKSKITMHPSISATVKDEMYVGEATNVVLSTASFRDAANNNLDEFANFDELVVTIQDLSVFERFLIYLEQHNTVQYLAFTLSIEIDQWDIVVYEKC